MSGIAVPNIILESQLDGSVNQYFDCVPTCIDIAVRALTGIRRGGAWWKDQVYGKGYVGGTKAAAYVSLVATCGVLLVGIDGSAPELDAAIHEQIAAGAPVILTEPDPYAPAHPDWSHVVLAFETEGGALGAVDPYGGHIVMRSDAGWEALFEYHQVWAFKRVPGRKYVAVPKGWSDKSNVLTAPNGNVVVKGFREYVLAASWPATSLPLENEQGDGQDGTVQVFTDRLLTWNAQDGVSEHPLGDFAIQARAQLAELQSETAEQAKQIASLQSQLAAALKSAPPQMSAALVAVLHASADMNAAIQAALGVAPA